MKALLGIGLAIALSVAAVGRAEAATITGDITFGGTLNPATDLGTTNSVVFNNPALVTFSDGDLAAIPFGANATFTNFTFDPFVGSVVPLWSVGPWSFDLEDVHVGEQNAIFLGLSGSGTLHGPAGFDDTPYIWSFSADKTGAIAFSATNTPVVPEPVTLSLLGVGLAGAAMARRRAAKKA
jgi:hypothetical protein